MRTFIGILLIPLLATASFAAESNNYQNTNQIKDGSAAENITTPSVYFNNKNYYLEQIMGNEVQWLNEYRIKDGTSSDPYQYLFAVHSFEILKEKPEQMAERLINYYKQQDMQLENYKKLKGNGEDFCVSFIHPQEDILEFNLFRFSTVNQHPIALHFIYREYAHADYERAVQKMQETINENLDNWENSIISMLIPEVYHKTTN